jgi:lipopolysaccharide/colanic/teichoic acid biosynthesis glycosyltransferase
VGPWTPVPDELSQHTLSDWRRLLPAKPGTTYVWQVSGRSYTPFKQQVETYSTYVESQSVWTDLLRKTTSRINGAQRILDQRMS